MSGTEEVLEMNVGSEIIPLVTDFLRVPAGVDRPSTGVERPWLGGGGSGPTGDGRADCTAEGGADKPGD